MGVAKKTTTDQLWRPTGALIIAVWFIAVALTFSIIFGRADFVAITLPIAIATAASLHQRPSQLSSATLAAPASGIAEGDKIDAIVTIASTDDVVVTAHIQTMVSPWIRLRHGAGRYVEAIAPTDETRLRIEGIAHRWGQHHIGPVLISLTACDGLLKSANLTIKAAPIKVFPVSEPFDSQQQLPIAAGLAGIHRSHRPGEGGELAEVRQFRAGDRLRRIDWRVSLRQRDLYVNATLSERDADVVIVMDVLHEAGKSGGIGGATSVLDATVRAAAAITKHYVHQGDRVAIQELGPQLRRLRAGTGRRHYLASLEWLLSTRRPTIGVATPERLIAASTQLPGALTIVLTPLIDERSTQALAAMARSGRRLLTVDTLAAHIRPEITSRYTALATRIWQLERENTMGSLTELGIPVTKWTGQGSLDVTLANMARLARAPKVVNR